MKIKRREFSFKEVDSQEKMNIIIEDIYNIVSMTFVGFEESDIRDIVQHPLNEDVRALMVSSGDKTVGFVVVQRMSLDIGSKTVSVFKSMAGIHPEYRRKVNLSSYAIEVVLKHKLHFPLREVYCFGLFIHPAVYYIFQRVCHEIYPGYQKETPEHYKKLIYRLAKKVGYEVEDAGKLTGKTPSLIRSIESTQVRDYWHNHSSPYVSDYIERTGYKEGIGVFTLVPFTWKNIGMTILKKVNFGEIFGKRKMMPEKIKDTASDKQIVRN